MKQKAKFREGQKVVITRWGGKPAKVHGVIERLDYHDGEEFFYRVQPYSPSDGKPLAVRNFPQKELKRG